MTPPDNLVAGVKFTLTCAKLSMAAIRFDTFRCCYVHTYVCIYVFKYVVDLNVRGARVIEQVGVQEITLGRAQVLG